MPIKTSGSTSVRSPTAGSGSSISESAGAGGAVRPSRRVSSELTAEGASGARSSVSGTAAVSAGCAGVAVRVLLGFRRGQLARALLRLLADRQAFEDVVEVGVAVAHCRFGPSRVAPSPGSAALVRLCLLNIGTRDLKLEGIRSGSRPVRPQLGPVTRENATKAPPVA